MRNRLNEAIQKVYAKRREARRYTAMLLVLAMLTSISVSWRLHYVGTALTTDEETFCGLEEHTHTDDCYEDVLVCGYEEGELVYPDADSEAEAEPAEPQYVKHEHTDACYQDVEVEEEVEEEKLTCGKEEHTHTDLCIDPDTGEYICGYEEEHTHDETCYSTVTKTVTKTERQLVCGYEEGQEVLADPADEPEETTTVEPEVHHHDESCYEKKLVCTIPEHTHTLECYADWSADTEDEDKWEQYSAPAQDDWNTALLTVAQSQLGYTESEKNFTVDEALGDAVDVHHYTRYGAYYGSPYADWDVLFVSFCQHYAGIPLSVIPQRAGLFALRSDMDNMNFAYLTEGEDAPYVAIPGDIVTYYNTDGDETIGIVEDCGDDTLTVISGAVNGTVARVDVLFTNVTSTIRVSDAYAEYMGEEPDSDAEPDDTTGSDFTTLEGGDDAAVDSALTIDDSKITEASISVKTSQGWKDLTDGETVNADDSMKMSYKFEGVDAKNIKDANYQVRVPLPENGIDYDSLMVDSEKNITDNTYTGTDGSHVSGTCKIVKGSDGKPYALITYKQDYIDRNKDSEGEVTGTVWSQFAYEFKWDKSQIDDSGKQEVIKIGDHTMTITVKKDSSDTPAKNKYDISKDASKLTYDGNGSAYIDYTVTLKVKGDVQAPIELEDILSGNNDAFKDFVYDATTGVKIESETKNVEAPSISWSDITNGKKIVLGQTGETIKEGKYTITYRIKNDKIGSEVYANSQIKNTISIQDGDKKDEKYKEDWFSTELIKKDGTANGKEINWTVNINNGSALKKLHGAKFTDTIDSDQTLKDSKIHVKKYDETGKLLEEKDVKITDSSKIDYPLDDGMYRYEITYTTTVTKDIALSGDKISNTGHYGDSDGNKGDSKKDVDVVNDDVSLTKKAVSNGFEISGTTAILQWESEITCDDLKGYTYEDYAESFYIENGHYAIHTITDDQINAIQLVDADGKTVQAGDDTFKISRFYKTDSHGNEVGLFKVEFAKNCTIKTPLKIRYKTTVDLSKLNSTGWYDIKNHADLYKDANDRKTSEATHHFQYLDTSWKYVLKYENGWNTTGKGDRELTNLDEPITWNILLNNEKIMERGSGDWVMTDEIPEGMILDEDSINISIEGLSGPYTNEHFEKHVTKENGKTVLKVTIHQAGYNNQNTADTEHPTLKITITYQTKLDPESEFYKGTDLTKTFTNTAKLEYKGKDYESSFDETVHVTRTEVLNKHGDYDETTGILTYTVEVNAKGEKLNNGSPLTLKDSLSVGSKLQGRVELTGITVFNAVRLSDGTLVATTPIGELQQSDTPDTTHYKYEFVAPYGGKDNDKKYPTFTTQVEDGKPLVLKCYYKLTKKQNGIALAEGEYELSNTVKLTGKTEWSKTDEETKASVSGSASSGVDIGTEKDYLTIIKYSEDQSNLLQGAIFELSKYENGNWTKVQDSQETNAKGETVLPKLDRDVLYKIEEVKAPSGYQKMTEPYYFYITSGTSAPAGIPEGITTHPYYVQENVQQPLFYYCDNTKIPDVPTGEISVEKIWKDVNGHQITDATKMQEVTVTLTKRVDDGKNQTIGSIKLNSANSWKGSWKNLETGSNIVYTLIEETVNGYSTTYTIDGSDVDKLEDGSITVAVGSYVYINNLETVDSGYELPSTGSTGTTPFTTAGALIMGAGLMYGIILKRRRGRRAE